MEHFYRKHSSNKEGAERLRAMPQQGVAAEVLLLPWRTTLILACGDCDSDGSRRVWCNLRRRIGKPAGGDKGCILSWTCFLQR